MTRRLLDQRAAPAIGAKLERQEPAPRLSRPQYDRAGPIREQDAGHTIGKVGDFRQRIGADHQRITADASLQH